MPQTIAPYQAIMSTTIDKPSSTSSAVSKETTVSAPDVTVACYDTASPCPV